MDIRKIGALRTLGLWEDLLGNLPQHAEGPEGLGRVWEHEDPPRTAGQDPVVKQGWRLAVVCGVEFNIPTEAEVIPVEAEQSATGQAYVLVRIDRTAVHLHGVQIVDGRVAGDVHVCVRVIWPKGAETRDADDRTAWRNYILYVDIYPPSTSSEPTQTLEVCPEGSERDPLIMLGSQEVEEDTNKPVVAWATRSANWRPAQGANPSVGSDQLIIFAPR
ncbi:hypothetical protein EPN81_00930 [Patescibacteria group bacterium]|nr:MAG: hypothetical protein EPN81_00930 [Patescibacteria group bacterium]